MSQRFGVLGPLVYERAGAAVPVPSGRQRALLALLLAETAPLSRDRLIDELWADSPPASAASALHVHLSKLRALLGGMLVLGPAGYSLRREDFELDVTRFDGLVAEARADSGRAAALLSEALAVFRGDPLCDVESEGTVARWRRALEEKRVQATLMRIDADLASGIAGELIGELEGLVGEHPFEERLREQLMVALYRAGRQADALHAYQQARRQFSEELGLDLGAQLVHLQEQILAHDPALQALPRRSETRPGRPSSLPRPLTRLVGREADLAALTGTLADPDVRLITLTGPGGVGKTRLLLELARQHEPHYLGGAVLVRLEHVTDPALVAAEIATSLAVRDATDGPGADALASYLRERELLVAIDNFEHLLVAAPLVAELLLAAPRIRMLVSSRTALRIRGEHQFEVEPLALPANPDDAEATGSPAVQLFLQCALAANRKLEIDIPMARTAAMICRAVDGLPLAIELAAARSGVLSPEQIADQLGHPLAIGEHALRDLPDRQQTLNATIAWSYELLAAPAQAVLRGAGVFLGGFTVSALEAVVGRAPEPALSELREASLVRRQGDSGRFELLELVRAFALEASRGTGEAVEARARHRRYFAELLAPVSVAFDGGASVGELSAQIRADHANLRAAFAEAVQDGDQESAAGIALGLRPLWLAGNVRVESDELTARLLEQFSIPGAQELALLRVAAALEQPAARWQRRFAERAAELGDMDALGVATTQIFAEAINARDGAEIRRLRPVLLALTAPGTSPRVLGWVHYSLFADAYIDDRFESACEYASLMVEVASQLGYSYMLLCALEARLLAGSAVSGEMTQPELAEVVVLARAHGVHSVAVAALWFVARYAAEVDPESARRWLALAERIRTEADAPGSLEDELREETMAVLGITNLGALLSAAPAFDPSTALDEAAAWVAARSPTEIASRKRVSQPA